MTNLKLVCNANCQSTIPYNYPNALSQPTLVRRVTNFHHVACNRGSLHHRFLIFQDVSFRHFKTWRPVDGGSLCNRGTCWNLTDGRFFAFLGGWRSSLFKYFHPKKARALPGLHRQHLSPPEIAEALTHLLSFSLATNVYISSSTKTLGCFGYGVIHLRFEMGYVT